MHIQGLFRGWPILTIALVMYLAALAGAGVSLWVTAYGLSKIAAGGYLGYWIDRLLYPYCRPHEFWWPTDRRSTLNGGRTSIPQIRRAIIVAACVLAAGLVP